MGNKSSMEVVMISNMEDREARAAQRKKIERMVYAATAIFLVVLIVGGFFGIRAVAGYLDQTEVEEVEAVSEEIPEEDTSEPEIVNPVETEPVIVEEPDVLGELADATIAYMTLEEKVAQLFIITPEALTGYAQVVKAGSSTEAALKQYPIGGLIYFSQNIQNEEQLKEMLENTVQYSKYLPFLAVDEEGGAVSRIANSSIHVDTYDDLNILGQTMSETGARTMGSTIGAYLSEFGFNLDLAPVADILIDEASPLKNRILSSDAEKVSLLTTAMMSGIQEQEVSSCMKHFPGIGSVSEDSHDTLPTTDRTIDEMRGEEFLPFASAIEAGVDMIMIGHIAAPAITGNSEPVSLSNIMVTNVLRKELGFEGVIITDSLQMDAITDSYSSDQAAVKAIEAGVDMLLMPEDFEEAYQGILTAVQNGTISEERINESVHRIFCLKYKYTELAN